MNTDSLSCKRVLYWFEELNKIPRGSGNEKAVSDMLLNFGKERGLYARQDEANNIIIKKPATKGMENVPAVIIQGHMDMVCEKLADSDHDFLKDPIKVIYEDGFIHADGTTLGGDDGIAVAYALALLEAEDIPHPELQVLITTDEEVGMCGASAVDCSDLTARRLINIDSEEEGVFTVGCAGGMKTTTLIPVEYEPTGERECMWLNIGGLLGGHSGVEIIKQRANANKLLARAVTALSEKLDIRVSSLFGGAKDNAIPRDSGCFIALKVGAAENAKEIIRQLSAELKEEFAAAGDEPVLTLSPCDPEPKVFTLDSMKRVVSAVALMPNGVIAMDLRLDMPQSSNNLGVIKTLEDKVSLTCAVRSSLISAKYEIYRNIKALSELAGGTCEYMGNYPAWEFKSGSEFLAQAEKIYESFYGEKPKEEIIHAGLECGLLGEKMPGCEMISIGPNMYDIHTPQERAEIASVERTWKFIKKLLGELR